MSGFGGAPAFGAQALSDATGQAPSSSPFQTAPSTAFSNSATSLQQSQSQAFPSFGFTKNATLNALGSTSSSTGGAFSGFNTTNKDAGMSNPFASAMAAPAGGSPNPFGMQSQNRAVGTSPFNNLTSSTTPSNPFGSAAPNNPFGSLANISNGAAPAFGQPAQQSGSASSPFGQPIQQSNRAASPFGQPQQSNNAASPFDQFFQPPNSAAPAPASSVQKRKSAFEEKTDSKRPGTSLATNPFQKPQTSSTTPATANTSNALGPYSAKNNTSNGSVGRQNKTASRATAATGRKKSPSLYAQEIHDQLRKDNLKPPPWPRNPGDPDNLKAVDDYRVKYKAYESKVRASLIRAGLIDDPEVRKNLIDAIDFRGICEDMCPEGEKVSRIVEHDVKQPERFRNTDTGRDGWANPDLMVKSFKRSAAGVDSPLPTEVRSPAALRRTVNYLIDDLLQGDENLPFMHGFLWDRTRAIRKDFIFQNAMTPEERIDQIYCLENITRFHAASLHLLSKDGKADFSEQQEREQLGKTLLSLIQVYDECKDMAITIENEAEFRAYFLLFNAHDPFVIQQMQDWSDRFWFESPEIQTAVSLIQAMQNTWNYRGPMKPSAPLTIGSPSFSSYFAIVEHPQVSYTMACVAEIHFTEIRRLVLKALHKSYARVRDGPKDLTAKVLNEMFRFDTEEECLEYLKDYDMEFSSEGTTEPYMIVVRRRGIPHKTVKQSSSQKMVERKRGNHSFPDVVHTTVFEEASSAVDRSDSPNSLFVTQPDPPMGAEHKLGPMDVSFTDDESPSSTPAPTKQSIAPPPTAFSIGSKFSQAKTTAAVDAPAKTLFFPQQPSASTIAPPATEKLEAAAQPASFSWTPNSSNNMFQATSAPEQPKQPLPTFSWTSNPDATSVSTNQGSGSVLNFLNEPPEQPQAPFFPRAAPKPSIAPSLFSTIPPVGNKDKSTETTSARKTSTDINAYQETPTVATSIFAVPVASAPTTTPFPFNPNVPASIPSTIPPLDVSNPFEPLNISTLAPNPVPAVMTSTVQAAKPQGRPRDMMGDFAKWVLLGDYGMMEHLEERILEDLLRQTYDQYQEEERQRKQREKDEKALAEALAYRAYSLKFKFLQLWKRNARRQFLRKAAKKNSVKIREWREQKAVEAKAEKTRKEKEERLRQKRLTGPTSWLEELDKERSIKRIRRESMSLDTSRRTSPASDAVALLATGVFDGLPDKQQFATNAVRDDDSLYDALVGVQISPETTRQVMGPPAKPVKDPLRSVRDARVSKQPPEQKWSKKAQALKDLISGKKKDDDLLSFRSSTSSRLGQSVRSVPGGKVTNFSKYQSSSPRSSAELDRPRKGSSSGIQSPYWLLRSRGLFATPTGHVLSDRAPRPRSGSIYDNASQYSGDSDVGDYDDRVLEQDGAYRASLGLTGGQSSPPSRRSTFSLGAAGSPSRSGLMKPKSSSLRQSLPAGGAATSMLDSRSQRGEADVASQADSVVSTMQQDVEETLRELRKVAAEMDEDTEWYREQTGRMSQGRHVGG